MSEYSVLERGIYSKVGDIESTAECVFYALGPTGRREDMPRYIEEMRALSPGETATIEGRSFGIGTNPGGTLSVRVRRLDG